VVLTMLFTVQKEPKLRNDLFLFLILVFEQQIETLHDVIEVHRRSQLLSLFVKKSNRQDRESNIENLIIHLGRVNNPGNQKLDKTIVTDTTLNDANEMHFF